MKQAYFLIIAVVVLVLSSCAKEKDTYVLIETDFGNMKVRLYNDTQLHKDNFLKLVDEKFYDGLLFHRIVKDFMIQGGDPESRNAHNAQTLGMGGPDYKIPAELGKIHRKGALAAARNGDATNPERKSSGSQFYIVQGTIQSDAQLNIWESRRGFKYNETQRELYKTIGGTPSLDNEYSVFGEVVEGFDVIDEIAKVAINPASRPLKDLPMTIKRTKK